MHSTRAPVRKVAHLLCADPGSPAVVRPEKRARRAPARGARGRFVERARVEASPTSSSDTAAPVRRGKFYQNATPSSHCHVCARTAKAVQFAVCARLQAGLCRKVICDKCFSRNNWDWDAAVNDANWTCAHCRGVCPPGRSQCFIYARVNRRRETKRAARAAAAAARASSAPPHVQPAALPSVRAQAVRMAPPPLVSPPVAPPAFAPTHAYIAPLSPSQAADPYFASRAPPPPLLALPRSRDSRAHLVARPTRIYPPRLPLELPPLFHLALGLPALRDQQA